LVCFFTYFVSFSSVWFEVSYPGLRHGYYRGLLELFEVLLHSTVVRSGLVFSGRAFFFRLLFAEIFWLVAAFFSCCWVFFMLFVG